VFSPEGEGSVTAELITDTESAVLVPFPEAERVVSPYRARLDGAAALGVPAHVTVLYPFVPPPAITPSVVDALAVAVASVSAFGCEFGATAWFGEDVLWLAPQPSAPFLALTRAVCAASAADPGAGQPGVADDGPPLPRQLAHPGRASPG
jgi:hypothetical protein